MTPLTLLETASNIQTLLRRAEPHSMEVEVLASFLEFITAYMHEYTLDSRDLLLEHAVRHALLEWDV